MCYFVAGLSLTVSGINERKHTMPRGSKPSVSPETPRKPNQPRKSATKDEWAGFVPCDLLADDKEQFDAWLLKMSEYVWTELQDALGSGLKFSLSYDATNECYVASLSGRPDPAGEHEFNAVLTARSGTDGDAIALLVYKHESLLEGDWWTALNRPKVNRRTWG